MLPESMICVLANRGTVAFAEALMSNVDTPEVIWKYSMRAHLLDMLAQHLGDLAQVGRGRRGEDTACGPVARGKSKRESKRAPVSPPIGSASRPTPARSTTTAPSRPSTTPTLRRSCGAPTTTSVTYATRSASRTGPSPTPWGCCGPCWTRGAPRCPRRARRRSTWTRRSACSACRRAAT